MLIWPPVALVLFAVPLALAETCPSLGDGWTTKLLSSDIDFYAHHKVVDSTLHLRLEGKTTGWLGFGFGEPTTGHTKGADMMTAYIAGDAVTVDDRYATFVSAKVANGVQDYMGLTAVKDKTKLIHQHNGQSRTQPTYLTGAARAPGRAAAPWAARRRQRARR